MLCTKRLKVQLTKRPKREFHIVISGQFRTFGMFFTHAFSWFSFYAFWEWQHPWIFDGSLFTGAFHQNIGSWSNISFSAFSPLCQSHSFVTLYKLSAVSQSDKVLISNFWRFDIKLHLRHSSTSTIFLWSQMSIKISLLKFELHGIPFKRMVLTRFKSKISLIWKMCSKVFEPQGSGRDQIIFSYFWRFSPNYFPTKILMLMLVCD